MAVLAVGKRIREVEKLGGFMTKSAIYVRFQEPLEVGENIGVASSEGERNHCTQLKDNGGFLHRLLCYHYNVIVAHVPSRE